MQFTYIKGSTPLSADEFHNLIPSHLTTQKELDEWEQFNIIKAERWAFKFKRHDILNMDFTKKLHKQMFNNTWLWAGVFRKKQTNIGVESIYIPQELKILFDDAVFWLEHNTYTLREIAIRLHHRLVYIHPFTNGNGRFSRLFADLVAYNKAELRFTWGRTNLVSDSNIRQEYLTALREADNGNYQNLIKFADS